MYKWQYLFTLPRRGGKNKKSLNVNCVKSKEEYLVLYIIWIF